MKNKMRARILLAAMAIFAGALVWAQQPDAKDAKQDCSCCKHHDAANHKDAANRSTNKDCCQSKDKQGAACCARKDVKAVAGKDTKADCCKDKADCCKDTKACCGEKTAQMCQSKDGKSCCADKGECAAKAAAAK